MNVGLIVLALRRQSSFGAFAIFALTWAAASSSDWTGSRGPNTDDLVRASLTREGMWTLLAIVIAASSVGRAAVVLSGHRSNELDWIAASPMRRGSWLASTWLGATLASTAFVALAALGVELRAQHGEPGTSFVHSIATPPIAVVETKRAMHWSLAADSLEAPEGARLRMRFAVAGGGSSAFVRVALHRGGATVEKTFTVGLRAPVELALPKGEGDALFELERLEDGALVVLDPHGLELVAPNASERLASAAIAVRTALGLAAAIALALGFSSWVSAPSAFAAVVALWIPFWLAERPSVWCPGGDVFVALDRIGEAIAPEVAPPQAFVGALAAVAVGLSLGSLARWRREA